MRSHSSEDLKKDLGPGVEIPGLNLGLDVSNDCVRIFEPVELFSP